MLSVERLVARLLLPYRPWSCVDLARLQVDFQLLKSEPSPVVAPTGSRGDGFESRASDPRERRPSERTEPGVRARARLALDAVKTRERNRR